MVFGGRDNSGRKIVLLILGKLLGVVFKVEYGDIKTKQNKKTFQVIFKEPGEMKLWRVITVGTPRVALKASYPRETM